MTRSNLPAGQTPGGLPADARTDLPGARANPPTGDPGLASSAGPGGGPGTPPGAGPGYPATASPALTAIAGRGPTIIPGQRPALPRPKRLRSPREPIDVTQDIRCIRIVMVNCYLVGDPDVSDPEWVLIDAGLPFSAGRILRAAEARFGPDRPPRAIILTHGHFDHVGGLHKLLERWHVPVYAHELELPYLTGASEYPPGDPSVGGGLLARIARLYPRGPINLGRCVQPLPEDGSVPHMPGWRWVPTPGHSPGHVSLFREADHVLLAGDAIATTHQESLASVLMQRRVLSGPPAQFTINWAAAWSSVQRLADLHPTVAASGHGPPMAGDELARGLARLAAHFDQEAVPRRGRYVRQPAVTDKTGVTYVPPPQPDPVMQTAGLLLVAAATFAVTWTLLRPERGRG